MEIAYDLNIMREGEFLVNHVREILDSFIERREIMLVYKNNFHGINCCSILGQESIAQK